MIHSKGGPKFGFSHVFDKTQNNFIKQYIESRGALTSAGTTTVRMNAIIDVRNGFNELLMLHCIV